MTRRLIAVVALVVLAAGCARAAGAREGGPTSGDVVTGNPGTGVSGNTAVNPHPDGSVPPPTPRVIEPRDGLVDIHDRTFDDVVVEDDSTLLLRYYSGVQDCVGLDHVQVDYGTDAVTVTVFEGRVPSDQACIDIAEFVAARVHLDEPRDGRTIIDGSSASPAPEASPQA